MWVNLCTSVDGCALTDSGVVADDGDGVLALELQVLRDSADDGRGEYSAVFTDTRSVEDAGVGHDLGACTYFYVVFDVCKRADVGGVVNLGARMNIC